MKYNKLVSVILPVRNGEKFIDTTIESILSQSYTNFEILIFDDFSFDTTRQLLESYNDKRIKIYRSKGFIENLNRGIKASRGEYISRIDADDIMYTNRLEEQLYILTSNKKIDLCGSSVDLIDVNSNLIGRYENYSGLISNPINKLLISNFLYHPSITLKKSFIEKNNLQYQKRFLYAEDYKLWFEMAKKEAVFYINEKPLTQYRIWDSQVTKIKQSAVEKIAVIIRREILKYLLENIKVPYRPLHSELYENLVKHHQNNFITEKQILNILTYILIKYD